MRFIVLALKLVIKNSLIFGLYFRFRRLWLRECKVRDEDLTFCFPIGPSDLDLNNYFKGRSGIKNHRQVVDDFLAGKVEIYGKKISIKDFKVANYQQLSEKLPGKDLRFIWEGYRNKLFFTVGIFYHQNKNSELEDAVINYVLDFDSFCPVKNRIGGPPYCAMEASLRLLNLYWIPYFFSKSPNYEKIEVRVKMIFQRYLNYIWLNYEVPFYGLESNHSLSDGFGLVFGALVLPDHPMSSKWFEFGCDVVFRAARKQFYSDGINFESSISYNRFVFEILVLSFVLIKKRRVEGIEEFQGSLKKIGLALAEVSHSNKMMPRFGDNDGGKVFYDYNTEEEFLSLKYLDWFKNSGESFIETLIFSQENELSELLLSGEKTHLTSYVVLKNNNLSLIAPRFNIGTNGKGNHQHCDFLSFELYGENPFIVDPWSYCYTADAELRNRDRSTKIHNNIFLDSREIVEFKQNRLFEMLGDIRIMTIKEKHSDLLSEVSLSHDGYRDLDGGKQIHYRTFKINKKSNEITILDTLAGKGYHSGELRFLVPKKYWELEIKGDSLLFSNLNEQFRVYSKSVILSVGDSVISPNFLQSESAFLVKAEFSYVEKFQMEIKIQHQRVS